MFPKLCGARLETVDVCAVCQSLVLLVSLLRDSCMTVGDKSHVVEFAAMAV